jgi:UDP-N-acetylglucosamine 3-dehydrogenase
MKVAVIGAGTMGTVHSESYAAMPGVELLGVVDHQRDKAQSLANRLGTFAYGSYEEMLAKDPDVIDICVPTPFHKDYIIRSAKAGKHVISEKPLALSLEDAEEAIQACKDHGVRLFVGQVVRFFPEYRKLHEIIEAGALGQVGTARTFRGGSFPTAWQDWYANAHMSGTLIVDLMIHDFDFLRWCFGEVDRVFAKQLLTHEANRLDHAFASLRFKNGVIAHVEGSWAAPSGFRTEFEIAGTKGMAHHKSDESTPIRLSERQVANGQSVVEVPDSPLLHNPYYVELRHFMDCIRENKPCIVEPLDALRALEISLAAVQSARTGEPVHLGRQDEGSAEA